MTGRLLRAGIGRSVASVVARVIVVGLAAILLWHALFAVLAADRGLDLTDEGLYLLAAQPPSPEAAWGTPAGWHTAPLFRAVGFDVAAFRTLGAFLLVVSSGVLGLLAVSVGRSVRQRELVEGRKRELVFGAAMGGLAGLLYYGGLLRTPSYNWVTVFGATVAAVGLLQVVISRLQSNEDSLRLAPQTSRWRRPTPYAWGVGIAGFGAFFTVPAKPTTPIFFAVLAIPVLGLAGGRRFVIRTLLLITGASLGFLVAAVVIGLWPMRFVPVLLEAIAAPGFRPEQNLSGALLTIPRFPLALLEDFRAMTAFALVLTVLLLSAGRSRSPRARRLLERPDLLVGGALIGLAVLSVAWRIIPTLVAFVHSLPVEGWSGLIMRNRYEYPVEGYVATAQRVLQRASPLVVGPAIGLLLLSIPSRWRLAVVPVVVIALLEVNHQLLVLMFNEPSEQYARQELTRGTFIVGLGLVLRAGLAHARHRDQLPVGRPRVSGQPLAAVVAVWLFAASTGFGSGHGLVRMAALAAGILIPALLLGVASLRDPLARRSGGVTVGVLVLSTALLYGMSNLLAPYHTEPIPAQTVLVAVGVDGATLRLDEDAARMLSDISRAARSAGWEDGTPILNVVSVWSPTIAWHLGATVPDSLILTIGGYEPASEDRLDFSLNRHVDERFESAWILVTAEHHERRGVSLEWAQRAAGRVGRTFPDDYWPVFQSELTSARWVAEFGAVELWRPKDD